MREKWCPTQLLTFMLIAVSVVFTEDNQNNSAVPVSKEEVAWPSSHNHDISGHDVLPMRGDEVLLQDRWPNINQHNPFMNTVGKPNIVQEEPQTSGSINYQVPHNGFPTSALTHNLDYYGTPYQPLNNFVPLKDHATGHRLEEGPNKHITAKDIAMAFLAYMAVLSILQGGIFTLIKDPPTLGIVATARNKREALQPVPVIPISTVQSQEQSWILGEEKQIRCIQRSLCAVNRQLTQELGITGKILGQYISSWTEKSVDSSWMRLVADAGIAGIRGVDCDVLYRGCHRVNQTGT